MARISRKQLKHDEFVETAVEASHWLERHWREVALAAGGGVLILLIAVGWLSWSRARGEAARDQLGEGLRAYGRAEDAGFADTAALEQALAAFTEVAESRGASAPGPAARYYRGVTLFRLGRAEEALAELARAAESADTPTLAATARVMQAEVLADSGKVEEAAAILERLAAGETSVYPPSEALLRLGWLHADRGEQERAQEIWQRLLDQYPESEAARQVTEVLGPAQGGAPGEQAAPAVR